MNRLLLLILVGLCMVMPASAQILNRWIQYGPNGQVLGRAIVQSGACPTMVTDAGTVQLGARNPPSATIPITVCEAPVPKSATTASIAGLALKLPVANPQRVVFIGDTGCNTLAPYQACNDPVAFPLANASQLIAGLNPDLVIHVGDFLYREGPCPAGNTGCAGSPYGDNWGAWQADWFTPARAIEEAVPLALARGNHESCARGNNGWFTLLDPYPYSAGAVTCKAGSDFDFEPTYSIAVGDTTVIMHDSSFANGTAVPQAAQISRYALDLGTVFGQLHGDAWLVTHRPPYPVLNVNLSAKPVQISGDNAVFEGVFQKGIPAPVSLLIAGHKHNFHYVDFGAPWPTELVVGDGGTVLSGSTPSLANATNLAGMVFTGPYTNQPILHGRYDLRFGFMVLDRVRFGWIASMRDENTGAIFAQCVIRTGSRNLECTSS